MKGILVILVILLAGLASAYTPEQQTTLDGMNLSIQYGIAYDKAIQGQNVPEFNALVDEYNAWIRQHFGEDAGLLKSKMNETPITPIVSGNAYLAMPLNTGVAYLIQSFNASSDLSKFGKPQRYVSVDPTQLNEDYLSQQEANNL
jgi:hypothetical protein